MKRLCNAGMLAVMTVREILKMGDARLLRVAQPVTEFDSDEIHQLVSDMFDTMRAADGAGLAAPQIGVDLQLVIFGTEDAEPALPRGAAGAAHRAAEPGDHAAGQRGGRGLGRVPVGAGAARRGAALGSHPLHRLRSVRRRASTARRRASMPGWCSTSATTWPASSTRCGCAISAGSASPTCCFPDWTRARTIDVTLKIAAAISELFSQCEDDRQAGSSSQRDRAACYSARSSTR